MVSKYVSVLIPLQSSDVYSSHDIWFELIFLPPLVTSNKKLFIHHQVIYDGRTLYYINTFQCISQKYTILLH